jgi:hypothetical protein
VKAIFDSLSADRYEFNHGRRPRGEGSWAFEFRGGRFPNKQVFVNGFYRDAKREAVEQATREAYGTVRLLP